MSRLVPVALAIVLGFTLVQYVRRAHVSRRGPAITVVGGSRDRRLSGKARVRARRAHRSEADYDDPIDEYRQAAQA